MVAKHLLEGIVEKVGGCMVGGTGIALVNIHTCHKVGRGVIRQLLDDMYALIVLALGVDDFHCLVLTDEHTAVAHLSSHLAIEGCVVEDNFIEALLLLYHFSISEDMALIFSIIISLEMLFAFLQHFPVTVLNCGSIAGTGFLLLHLHIESCLIYGVSVFAAYKLCEIEGESVGVEHSECLCTIEHCLTVCLQLIHCTVEKVDTLVESAEEGVFLFFHYPADKLALCNEFGIGAAHLADKYR